MSKAIKPLIFFISFFHALLLKDKFFEKYNNIRESSPVSNMKYFNQIVKEIEEERESFVSQGIFDDFKTVKCFYLNEYDIYDISPLTKNFEENNNEIPNNFTKIVNGSKYTIYFNFCNDLKKSDQFQYYDKQAYYKKDNGEYSVLAGSLSIGNKWEKEKNDDLFKITVNQDKNSKNTFTYILKCDKNGKDKEFIIDSLNSTITEVDKGLNVLLYILSKEACKKADFYFISKYIQKYKNIFIVILIGFGLFNCIFGLKLIKYSGFFLSLLIFPILFLFLGQYVLPKECPEWVIWIFLIVFLIFGLSVGFFVVKYYDKLFPLIGGISLGFFIGELIYIFIGHEIPVNGLSINIAFKVIAIGIMITITYFHKEYIFIATSPFIGSYCFIWGIFFLASRFPEVSIIMDLRTKNEVYQLKELITWKPWIYFIEVILLTVVSLLIAFLIYRDFGKLINLIKNINNDNHSHKEYGLLDSVDENIIENNADNHKRSEDLFNSNYKKESVNDNFKDLEVLSDTNLKKVNTTDDNDENKDSKGENDTNLINNKINSYDRDKVSESLNDSNLIKVIDMTDNDIDVIKLHFRSSNQLLNFKVLCNTNTIFNIIINKILREEYKLSDENNFYFLCNGNKVNDYKTVKDNKLKDGDAIIMQIVE